MDFQELPINKILSEIDNEQNASKAFERILSLAHISLPSKIWDNFRKMNFSDDIEEATNWLQTTIDKFLGTKGIYLGLETLNMNNGKGTNLEIGLNKECDPSQIDDGWTYDCEYGKNHLIKSLFLVSAIFNDNQRWSNDETSFAEYLIFLSYSGLILREALLKLELKNDFISMWGFHDGDMFFLAQKIGIKTNLIAEKSM